MFVSAIDLTYGTILCFACGDYVYDTEIEHIAEAQQKIAEQWMGKGYYRQQTMHIVQEALSHW